MDLDWDYSPLQIAALYFLLGITALVFFDVVLLVGLDDPAFLRQIQFAKGAMEVLLTAGLIYFLTRRSRASLRRVNRKLEERGRALEVMNRVLRHNVRNDVNIVLGYADMLRQETGDDKLDTITKVTREISSYTGKAEKIKEVMQEPADTSTIELDEVVEKIAETAGREYDTEIRYDVPTGTRVMAHPMLEHGLTELVENAVKHNDANDPFVSVSAEEAGDEVRVVIRDNGPGIPEQERSVLEEGVETPLSHASGLGLWLAYWIMHESGGRMQITDNEPRGSVVSVYLPQPT